MEPNQNQALSTDLSQTTTDQERAEKMITDLWGAMIALFGVRWSSQFGEVVDKSGQWTQTLSGISRNQVAEALSEVRKSGRAWPPTAPEFRSMCISGGIEHPTVEDAYSTLHRYLTGQIEESELGVAVRHTINKNMDLYQFKRLPIDKAIEVFRFAYKATLNQIAAGDELFQPRAPVALIEDVPVQVSPEEAEAARLRLLSLFDDPEQPEPEINDQAALGRKALELAKQRLAKGE